MDLSELRHAPPCEPIKNLFYVVETDEVISEFERKYPNRSKRFSHYKQLCEQKSREWFCSPELIKFYEFWDCKNKNEFKLKNFYS